MKRLIAGYGFSEAIAKGLNLVFSLSLTRFFDSSSYGIIAIIISIEQILIALISFNQQTVVLRSYSLFRGKRTQLYISSILIIGLLACIVLLLYGVYLLLPVSGLIQGITDTDLLLIIIAAIFQGAFAFHLAFLRGSEKVFEYGIFRVLYPGFKIVLIITISVLIREATAYPAGVFAANIVLFLVIAVRNNHHIIRHTAGFRSIIKSSWQYVKPSVYIGFPLTIQGTIGTLYSVIDRFILQHFFDSQQVGIYFFAFLQGSACIFVLDVLSLAYVPRIYHGEEYTPEIAGLLSKFLRIAILCTCVLSFFVYFIVFPVSLNFVDAEYDEGRIVVLLVLISTIIDPIRLYGLYKMTFFRKVAMIPVIGIVAFLLRVLFGLLFIPAYGIIGAAVAVVMSVLLNALLTAGVAHNIQKSFFATHKNNTV